jgi:hypothetical protein
MLQKTIGFLPKIVLIPYMDLWVKQIFNFKMNTSYDNQIVFKG